MQIYPQRLPETLVIEPDIYKDSRGFFLESYNQDVFKEFGLQSEFVQDNHSQSMKGVIRGLHFQKTPYEQGKLIRVVRGAIFDVAVDIRSDSKTFGEWTGVFLSEENHNLFYIPPGFAHGFCSLEDYTNVLYKATVRYHPEKDGGLLWNDPAINIKWPKLDCDYILSEKDKKLPLLKELSD